MPVIAEDTAQHGFAYRFGWGAEGLEALAPACSPEAAAARAAFIDAKPQLVDRLVTSASGRQLARIGFADDVANAAQLDASRVTAQLIDGAFALR